MSPDPWQGFLDLSQIVTALMAVAGVVVAAVLGWRGVQIAANGVDRARKDHVASRALECSGAMTRVHREVAQVKGALHPYWKGREFSRMDRLEVIQRESQVHECTYLLDAELKGLRISLDGLSEIFDGLAVDSFDSKDWKRQVEVAKARATLINRAVITHYLSLVPEDEGWGKDKPEIWVRVQTLGNASDPKEDHHEDLFNAWARSRDFDADVDLARRSIALLEDMTKALDDEIAKITASVMSAALK